MRDFWNALRIASLAFAAALACPASAQDSTAPGQSEFTLEDACRAQAEGCEIVPERDALSTFEGSVEMGDAGVDPVASPRDLLAACDRGDARRCADLALLFAAGLGVEANMPISDVLFLQACEGGVGTACARVASGKPAEQARPLYERGCTLGEKDACAYLARSLFVDENLGIDPGRGAQLSGDLCDADFAPACEVLANVAKDYPAAAGPAIAFFDRRCRAGEATDCERGAAVLSDARPDDVAGSNAFLDRACEFGEAYVCVMRARKAAENLDNEAARIAALPWMETACRKEANYCGAARNLREIPANQAACGPRNAQACMALGEAYGTSAVLADPLLAEAAFDEACRRGIGDACVRQYNELVMTVAHNTPDKGRKVLASLTRGCALASGEACRQLGYSLLDERYGRPDPVRAGEAFKKGCTLAETRACEELEEMGGLVPSSPLAEVDATLTPPDEPDPMSVAALAASAKVEPCYLRTLRFRGQAYQWLDCNPNPASIGGFRAGRSKVPWQALLERPTRINGQEVTGTARVACGGSLIAPGWILTAAHCIYDQNQNLAKAGYRIRLGVFSSLSDEGMSYPILRVVPHPNYLKGDKLQKWDIALIRFAADKPEKKGPVGRVAKIRVDPRSVAERELSKGTTVYSFGWGWTEAFNSRATDELRGVRMETSSMQDCSRETGFTGDLAVTLICAVGENKAQSCKGDSGGPLVFYGDADKVPTLIGVVSAGVDCGANGATSRYTRIAPVKDWIDRTIGARSAR